MENVEKTIKEEIELFKKLKSPEIKKLFVFTYPKKTKELYSYLFI